MMTATATEDAPETWEDACEQALRYVLWHVLEPLPEWVTEDIEANGGLDLIEQEMRVDLDGAIEATDDDGRAVALGALARFAMSWMHFDGYDVPTVEWMVEKLAEKQSNYGTGNILKFGSYGLVVRSSDKVERISNMRANGRTSDEESLFDSLFDLIGYATIGQMLAEGTFELPLWADSSEGKLAVAIDEATVEVEEKAAAWRARFEAAVPEELHDTFPFDKAVAEALDLGLDPTVTRVIAKQGPLD